ncbi:hypothetical protein ACIQNU_03520 [Streptomyces sp. NPDC091292]|uniref:hypothetical protein n=1 Tax=Streptomyces sp. NPDC091292 TaxID=3365991 RepID=UPI00380CB612
MTAPGEDQDLADVQFFEIPHMRQLTTEQNEGTTCVWCAEPLAPGTGVALCTGSTWAPHSCRPCYPIRAAIVSTYRDLYTHWTTCRQCETAALLGDRLCAEARHGQTALLRARTAADKGRPVCFSCHNPITEQELAAGTFAPLVWTGPSASHRGFIHTGACMWNESPW